MSDETIKLTDEAVEKLFASILMNVISSGEDEAKLLSTEEALTDEQVMILMKSNALYTVAAMYFMTVLQDKDMNTMRKILTIWATPMVQDLINIAFVEEIENAGKSVEDAITKMEEEANKDASS